MSRIGRQPIELPSAVKVSQKEAGTVLVEGPKGKLTIDYPAQITLTIEAGQVQCVWPEDQPSAKAFFGLTRTLIGNAVHGVSQGFKKDLELHGVGYRADVKGKDLHLSLGFSHPVIFPVPDGIEIKVEKQTKLAISGIDKVQVGQVAADIRKFRPTDPYKQKGVRYVGERLRKKAGKQAA